MRVYGQIVTVEFKKITNEIVFMNDKVRSIEVKDSMFLVVDPFLDTLLSGVHTQPMWF